MLYKDLKLTIVSTIVVIMGCLSASVYFIYKYCFKKNTARTPPSAAPDQRLGSPTIGFLGFRRPGIHFYCATTPTVALVVWPCSRYRGQCHRQLPCWPFAAECGSGQKAILPKAQKRAFGLCYPCPLPACGLGPDLIVAKPSGFWSAFRGTQWASPSFDPR